MSTFLVDSSVILAILAKNENYDKAHDVLLRAQAQGALLFNGIIAAEVSAKFTKVDDYHAAMSGLGLIYENFGMDTPFFAGQLWKGYLKSGGKRRERIIADFLIAACGMECDGMVTLDDRFPRIPGLKVFS